MVTRYCTEAIPGIALQREGEVEPDHVGVGRPARRDPQPDADVGEPAAVGRSRGPSGEPGLAEVGEGGGAEADDLEELALAVPALLEVEQEAAIALLIAQGVAAQAGVAAEQELLIGLEVVREVEGGRGEEGLTPEVAHVVTQAQRSDERRGAAAIEPALERERGEEELTRRGPPAARRARFEEQRVAIGAKAARGPPDACGGAPAQVEVLGAVDPVDVSLDDEAVLEPLPGDPGVDQTAVRRQRRQRVVGVRREGAVVEGDTDAQPADGRPGQAPRPAEPRFDPLVAATKAASCASPSS